MFDRVSDKLRSNGSAAVDDFDASLSESLLEGAEEVQHVLVSEKGIEHTTGGRTTTIQPGDDCYAYAVVTDRRLVYFLGDDPGTAEVALDLGMLTRVDVTEGLLQKTFLAVTDEDTVKFQPSGGDDPEEFADHVDRISDAWGDLHIALRNAEEALADLEESLEDGADPKDGRNRVQTRLSNAHHAATYHDDAPTEVMQAEIEPLEDRLDQLMIVGRVDRIADLVADVRDARESDDREAAYEAFVEASDVVREARGVLSDPDDAPGDAGDRLVDLEAELEDLGEDLVAEPEINCQRAMDADDPATTADAWAAAYEGYRAALAADWDDHAGVDAEAFRFQLAWVVRNFLDALEAHAAAIESEADDLDDGAKERFEDARDRLERAQRIASEYPYASADRFADALERVQEKIERAEWQWGSAD